MFGAVKLTKHFDIDKYKYSENGTELNRKGTFSVGNGFGRNCIVFGIGMSSSVDVDNKKKKNLILGVGPTKAIDTTTLIAKKKYSINFTENDKTFCLSLLYSEANSYVC